MFLYYTHTNFFLCSFIGYKGFINFQINSIIIEIPSIKYFNTCGWSIQIWDRWNK